MKSLSILSVAYPFAPVRPDTAGGAEQVLLALDHALVSHGHRSVVLGDERSQVAGGLIAIGAERDVLTEERRGATHARYRAAIDTALTRERFDLVHFHGVDFAEYLPASDLPVLVTLHLPLAWYAHDALHPARRNTFLHCVSPAQTRGHDVSHLLPPIENGVAIPNGAISRRDGGYALMLARICPEKGVHLAIDAAKAAGVPLVIAGEVYPYEEHQRYFDTDVLPRLDDIRHFIGPVGGTEKQRLLADARCVLVASTVDETSSLVAREALAAGTPVIAFARGALVDTIEHGRTGFLVQDVAGMADAIGQAETIDRKTCRAVASERFSQSKMISRYFAVYRSLAAGETSRLGHAA